MGGGFLAINYSPSIDRQSTFDYNQVNHSLAVSYDRKMGAWRFSAGVHGATMNQFSTFFQQDPFQPVLTLQVPVTNMDLFNILNEPQVFQAPQRELTLTDRRMAVGSLGVSLSRRLSPRDDLTFTSYYGLNRSFDPETSQGILLADYRSNYLLNGISLSHRLSRRQSVIVSVHDRRIKHARGHSDQQSLEFGYRFTVGRRWHLSMSSGPGFQRHSASFTGVQASSQKTGFQPTIPVNAQVSYAGRSAVVSTGFSRNLYSGGLANGQQSNLLQATYSPTLQGHRWRYSLGGGYQWIFTADGRQAASGWTIRPGFTLPLTRTMMFSVQYAFFQQHFNSGVGNPGSLQGFNRYMVTVGLRWNFASLQGRAEQGP
jgi:hypothetical protein